MRWGSAAIILQRSPNGRLLCSLIFLMRPVEAARSPRGSPPPDRFASSTPRQRSNADDWRRLRSASRQRRSPRRRSARPRCRSPRRPRRCAGRYRSPGSARCGHARTPSGPGSCPRGPERRTIDSQVDLNLATELPLRADREDVADDEHPDHQHRIDRRPTDLRVVGASSP